VVSGYKRLSKNGYSRLYPSGRSILVGGDITIQYNVSRFPIKTMKAVRKKLDFFNSGTCTAI